MATFAGETGDEPASGNRIARKGERHFDFIAGTIAPFHECLPPVNLDGTSGDGYADMQTISTSTGVSFAQGLKRQWLVPLPSSDFPPTLSIRIRPPYLFLWSYFPPFVPVRDPMKKRQEIWDV
jgi:hypothetical protein